MSKAAMLTTLALYTIMVNAAGLLIHEALHCAPAFHAGEICGLSVDQGAMYAHTDNYLSHAVVYPIHIGVVVLLMVPMLAWLRLSNQRPGAANV